MQIQSKTVQLKSTEKHGQPAKPLPAPAPLSPDQLQFVSGAGGTRMPKNSW
jgi:hypothetical protein